MKIKKITETLVLIAILIIFLLNSSPYRISLPFILIPYILIALIFYRLVMFILQGLFVNSAASPKLRLYALIITVLLTNFALLKSIGQLTLQDGLISAAIVVISTIYISKFSFGN